MEILEKKYLKILNELLILTQPGHLQKKFECREGALERDLHRAKLVRERFVDVKV